MSQTHRSRTLGFISPPGGGTLGRPLKTLFGFERVHVKAGQTMKVWLYPKRTDFAEVVSDGERFALPGEYRVIFGVKAKGMGWAERRVVTK